MPFMLGENVGPYRLIEQLGQGGMATVFKAYHARLDRYVAIKALHPAFMTDPNFKARFQREARVVAKLEHPNIVPIYDFADHEERPYLVLKYVEGETLKSRLIHENVTSEDIKNIFEAVSAALAYAHQEGVLHRDIKPSNVLMASDGRIYLADFGLARMAQAGESTLSTDMMLGTPQYVSPEQAKGISDLDEGTDIYSLGVMLYELLVGKVPFSADTPFSVIHDHIYSPLPLPREVNPEISESLERALLKSLAKDREDRYQDVPAMAETFQKIFDKPEDNILLSEKPPREVEKETADESSSPAITPSAEEESPPPPVVEPPPQPSDAEEAEVPAKAQKRSLPNWVWWMGIPAFCLCCLIGFFILKAVNAPGPSEIGEVVELRNIEEIEQKLEENPEDLNLRMNLAIAYWEEENFEEAEEEIYDVFMSIEDEPYLYYDYGNLLALHGAWIYAAPFYVMAERHMPSPPQEIGNLIHQAVYFASFDPKATDILLDPELALEKSMTELVLAREALMNDNFEGAERSLNSAFDLQPDMPEAILFEADLRSAQGDVERALEILEDLRTRKDIPAWIDEEIEQLEEEISGHKDDDSIEEIKENADDPYAYVEKALQYWEEGNRQQAEEAAFRAFELVGEDSLLYRKLGDRFSEDQVWLYAAPAYLLAYKHSEGEESALMSLSNEAVYFASFEEEAMGILDRPGLELNPLMKDLVEVRHEIEAGNLDRAENILHPILERKPNYLAAHLLEADLLLKRGKIDSAKEVILSLQRDEKLPEWIRLQTQELWRKINEQE